MEVAPAGAVVGAMWTREEEAAWTARGDCAREAVRSATYTVTLRAGTNLFIGGPLRFPHGEAEVPMTLSGHVREKRVNPVDRAFVLKGLSAGWEICSAGLQKMWNWRVESVVTVP